MTVYQIIDRKVDYRIRGYEYLIMIKQLAKHT